MATTTINSVDPFPGLDAFEGLIAREEVVGKRKRRVVRVEIHWRDSLF